MFFFLIAGFLPIYRRGFVGIEALKVLKYDDVYDAFLSGFDMELQQKQHGLPRYIH